MELFTFYIAAVLVIDALLSWNTKPKHLPDGLDNYMFGDDKKCPHCQNDRHQMTVSPKGHIFVEPCFHCLKEAREEKKEVALPWHKKIIQEMTTYFKK